MSNLLVSLLFPLMVLSNPDSTAINQDPVFDKENCTYNGIPLYCRVKIVISFEDFKVRIVNSFEDIRVETVTSFADDCGKWQFVESFEDFTIQFVDSFEDFKIR